MVGDLVYYMDDVIAVKKLILNKLVRSNMWGGKHTPVDFVLKSLPEHLRTRPEGKRAIDRALKELSNNGWISVLKKRTGKDYDDHVSLNQENVSEIQKFLAEHP